MYFVEVRIENLARNNAVPLFALMLPLCQDLTLLNVYIRNEPTQSRLTVSKVTVYVLKKDRINEIIQIKYLKALVYFVLYDSSYFVVFSVLIRERELNE